MTCSITQDDLGPAFADVDAELAELFIETATGLVLGVLACQAETEVKWSNCCLDACLAIKLLAQHLLVVTPNSGASESPAVTSKRVGEISVTYASASSSSGLYAGSPYGSMYAMLLGKFELCQNTRNTLPFAASGGCGCS
jgi:hypothetical protein